MPSEELQSGAMYIYESLSAEGKSDAQKRERLRNIFGSSTLDSKTFEQALSLATQLAQWREQRSASNGSSDQAPSASVLQALEFGKDIHLSFDSDFLVDMFIKLQNNDGPSPLTIPDDFEEGCRFEGPIIQSAGKKKTKERIDTEWLSVQCFHHVQATGSTLSAQELASSILRILRDRSVASNLALQDQLFALLGESGFEFISQLIQNRSRLLTIYSNSTVPSSRTAAPLVGCQFTVTSEDDKFLRKLQRKEERKKGRRGLKRSQEDWLNEIGWNPEQMKLIREQELQQVSTHHWFLPTPSYEMKFL